MVIRKAMFVCLILLVYGTANAQTDGLEGCHFEIVDYTVSITESLGWDDLFFQGTPYEDAMEELVEELDEELGSEPAPGYYQIRYYVRAGWWPSVVPITQCQR